MSKYQRDKGARFEREICNEIESITGFPARRNLTQTRDGGYDIAFGKFRLECKARKSLSVYAFIEQCEAACSPSNVPVVICKADRKEPLVLMRFKDALPLLAGELTEDDYAEAQNA